MTTTPKNVYSRHLPVRLIDAIEALPLTGAPRATAIQIVWSILLSQRRAYCDSETFVAIPKSYFTAIDSNYYRALKVLKAESRSPSPNAIVEVERNIHGKESYSTDQQVSKAYRINPTLLNGPQRDILYATKPKRKKRTLSAEMFMWLESDFAQLGIDTEDAVRFKNDYVSSLDLQEWVVDERSEEYRGNEVLFDVRFGTRSKTYHCKTRNLLDKLQADGKGEQVFRTGKNGFVVDTPTEFKRRKVGDILSSWSRAIYNLKHNVFEPERTRNNRLLTPLTEFPKLLLPFIHVEGVELEEVDIANSQVALLVFLWEKGDTLGIGLTLPTMEINEGTQRFIERTQAGYIYDDFAESCGRSREWAKREMFRLLFSQAPRNMPSWKYFAQRYGAVASWLVEFNLANHDLFSNPDLPLNLASYLQRVEAAIIIDKVYPRIKKAGLTCFTKHDSLLCPPWDISEAKSILLEVFEEVGLKAKIRTKVSVAEKSVPAPPPLATASTPKSQIHMASIPRNIAADIDLSETDLDQILELAFRHAPERVS